MIRRRRALLFSGAPVFAMAGACTSEPLDTKLATEQPSCYGQVATTERYDGETHMPTTVSATCRGEGDRAFLFVEDALFGTRVTQAGVDAFLDHYELTGNPRSYRPDLGILPTDEAVFGELPEAQVPEGKLPVFVIDSHGGGDGYLCGWCSRPELHLDAVALTPLDSEKALGIAAHESFHAIHRGYDPEEAVWVDETLAEAAMVVNGFTDESWLKSFLARPNVNWGPAIQAFTDFHYGGGLVFGAYLWDTGGPELMRAITQEPKHSWAGIDAALAAVGSSKDGHALFLDMAVALFVADAERGYGFRSLELSGSVTLAALPADSAATGTIQPYGLVYRSIPSGIETLTVTGGAALRARLVRDTEPLEVQDLVLGREVPLDEAPSVLILTAVQTTSPVSYSVTPG